MPMPLWMREILGAFRSNKSNGRRVEIGGQLLVRRMEERRVLDGVPPTANPDTFNVVEGDSVSGNVLTNDSDDLAMTASKQSDPPGNVGPFTLDSNGGFTYSHDGLSNESKTFLYRAVSADGPSVDTLVTINVTPVNDAPDGGDNTVSVNEDNSYIFTTADFGFTDADDAPDENSLLAVKIATLPTAGTLTLDGDEVVAGDSVLASDIALGKLQFTPDNNANGAGYATFTFQVQDDGGTALGGADLDPTPNTMTINVTAVNDPPVAGSDTATVLEDSSNNVIDVLANDSPGPSNESAQTLTVTAASALHGTVTINPDNTLNYTPDADYNGPDSITYTIEDSGTPNQSSDGTVAVTITSVNDAPTGTDSTIEIAEDTVKTFSAADFGFDDANDSPEDSLQEVQIVSLPLSGTLMLDGVEVDDDQIIPVADLNKLTFTPAPDENDSAYATILFKVTDTGGTDDGGVDTALTPNTITIDVTEVNDVPEANADSASVAEDSVDNTIDVLGNDVAGPTNESGQTLTVISASALHGTVTINPDNTLSYTPDANYNGPDTITYTIEDDGTTDGASDPETAQGTVTVTVTEINDGPTANDDTATVAEDSDDNTITVIANDSTGPANESGQTLTVISASALHGTVTINPDNTLSYTPDANYNGPDTITYTIEDDGTTNGADDFKTDQGSVAVTVTEINDAPSAGADTATVAEDSIDNTITVIANDSTGPANESGQTLTVISASALHGTVTINPDNTLCYTPDANYNGPDTITYTIEDDGTTNGASDPETAQGTVTVTVTEINDGPMANDDTATVAEDSDDNTITVIANDSTGPANESGQTLTVTSASALHGTVTINPDNTLSYTPNANYNGPDTITYTIEDDGTTNGGNDFKTDQGSVAVTVTEINDPPTANPDSATVAEDSIDNTITVIANDSTGPANEGGQTLTVISASALHGTVTINPDNTLSYTPDANYNGPDTITYTIEDDGTTNGASDPETAQGTVTVTVTEINDAPTANDDTATVAEDSDDNTITVIANDSTGPANESGQTLTVTSASALHGTVTINPDNTLSYTPDANYNGPDTITYTIEDDGTTNGADDFKTDQGSVAVTVTEINDAPSAGADTATVAEDSIDNTITVIANDSTGPANEGGQTLTVISASALHGTVTINPDNTLSYTPDANYNGPDTITSTIEDNGTTNGASDFKTSTSTVAVTVTEVNDSPTTAADSATVAEDGISAPIDVLGNDSSGPANENSQTLTVISATALHGTVVINPDNTLTYTPDPNYNGSDTITYTIEDNGTTNGANDSKTAQGTVAVTVTEVNDSPTANPDSATVAEDSIDNTITVLINDSKGPTNESGQTLTVISASALHGTVTINPDNTLSYTPDANYNGPDTITYTIEDNGTTNGASDFKTSTSTVAVTVTEVNDAPTTAPDTATVAEDGVSAPIDVLGNDSPGPANESGQTLTVISATALHGTVVINPDNTLTYTPDPNYNGSDTITYTIEDNGTTNGASDFKTAQGTVAVTVTEVNDSPTANPDSATVTEDSIGNTITVLTNDSKGPTNESGQTLTVISASALHGAVTINPDNTLSYTPDPNYNGPDTITYTIQDNGTTNGANDFLTSTSTVSVTVTEVNDVPTTAPDSASVAEDGVSTPINVIGNDSTGPANESGQTLTVISATALHGTVVINPDNTLTYTPSANYNGPDTITYTIQDNGTTNGANDFKTAVGTVNVTVTEVNDTPSATADTATLNEDGTLTISLIGNDSKGPANESAQTLTVTNIDTTGTQGTVIDNGDGTITFIPNANFAGTTSFTYTVTDNGTTNGAAAPLTSNVTTVTYTVQAVADTPDLNLVTTSLDGIEGDTLALNWSGGLTDTDGSETLAYQLSGVPTNAVITDANGVTHTGQSTYTFTQSQIGGMTIFFPDNPAPGTPAMTLRAISTEQPGPGIVIATPTATNQQSIGLNVVNVAPTGTAVASQIGADQTTNITGTISEPGNDTVTVTYIWGDPGAPDETTPPLPSGTTAFAGSHTYVLAPNPANPSAPVPIAIVLTDDEGASTTINVVAAVAGTGLTAAVAPPPTATLDPIIVATPVVFAPPTQTNPILIVNQTLDQSGAGGEAGVNVERRILLNVLSPTGNVVGQYEITDEALADLPKFFKNFPNGRYQIFVLQAQGKLQKARLVIDVEVRQGKPIAPGDDGEGTRDRPPGSAANTTSEETPNNQAMEEHLRTLDRMWEKWRPRGPLPTVETPLRGAMLPATQSPAVAGFAEFDSDEAASAFQPPMAGALLAGHMAAYALDRRWSEEVDEAMSRARPIRRRFNKKQG